MFAGAIAAESAVRRCSGEQFFGNIRARAAVDVACEPRHESWFREDADQLLAESQIARVAADPAPVIAAASPGGWRGMSYYRLHGSPHVYRSAYLEAFIVGLARHVRQRSRGRPEGLGHFRQHNVGSCNGQCC